MSITISFELSDRDLEHFVAMANEAHQAVAQRKDAAAQIVAATRDVFETARNSELPDFIAQRLNKLGVLADMITDNEWMLPDEDLERVLGALAYFADPADLIPDRVPGIGFLDDAIMAELVVTNLEAEIAAYKEFCVYRSTEEERRAKNGLPTDVGREEWLADKRAVMHNRMRARRRERVSAGGWRARLW